MTAPARSRIRVAGIVQGVGFRPFVHALAAEFGLAGFVGNDETGVLIEAEGPPAALSGFVAALRERAARAGRGDGRRRPRRSPPSATPPSRSPRAPRTARAPTLVSPDTATCADCLRELRDPADRRYRYPFINCTNCGPRFTIVTGVPYDRAATTMAAVPDVRRLRAGVRRPRGPAVPRAAGVLPGVRAAAAAGRGARRRRPADPIAAAAARCAPAPSLAVKGLGGYHLAALAADEAAVGDAARAQAPGGQAVRRPWLPTSPPRVPLAELDAAEEEALTSPARPIVLLPPPPRRRAGAVRRARQPLRRRAAAVHAAAPPARSPRRGRPLVLTSGNVSDEPIAYRDDDAADRLGRIADAVPRPTTGPSTPAPTTPWCGWCAAGCCRSAAPAGYAPEPLALAVAVGRPVLGVRRRAQEHVLPRPRARRRSSPTTSATSRTSRRCASFTEGVAHYRRLFDVEPAVVAHDLHPEYLSTKYALDLAGVDLVGVQHHHAHLASCLADNGEAGPVIGLACDGLGYGTDGMLWGGEVMECRSPASGASRTWRRWRCPAGRRRSAQPWRMAASWLRAAGIDGGDLPVARRNPGWATVGGCWTRGGPARDDQCGPAVRRRRSAVGVRDPRQLRGPGGDRTGAGRRTSRPPAPPGPPRAGSSSRGRSSRAAPDPRESVQTDARMSRSGPPNGYPARTSGGLLYGSDLIRGVVTDLRAGVEVPLIAARFHARPGRPAHPRRRRRVCDHRPRHRRAVGRGVPERAPAPPAHRRPRRRRAPGAHPLPGPAERRGCQPGPGRRRRRPRPN